MENDETKLLTEEEAASILRMHRITLLRLRKEGKISFLRLGTGRGRVFYTPEQLQEFLARSQTKSEYQ